MSPEKSDHPILLCYALFKAHPSTKPPFTIEVGLQGGTTYELTDCAHIPDGITRLNDFCKTNGHSFHSNFTLLYPIYMDAMGSEDESTMHSIAWLIKDEADAHKWNFDRTEGLTGRTTRDFLF